MEWPSLVAGLDCLDLDSAAATKTQWTQVITWGVLPGNMCEFQAADLLLWVTILEYNYYLVAWLLHVASCHSGPHCFGS